MHPTPRNLQGTIVQPVEKPIVKPPENIIIQEDMTELFNPLLQYLYAATQADKKNSAQTAGTTQAKISKYLVTTTLHDQITQIGSIIIKSNGPRMRSAIQDGDQDGTKHKYNPTVLIQMRSN